MGLRSDFSVLYHLLLSPVRGNTHKARLESFYAGQASNYDDFRKRLLQGREELYGNLDIPEDAVWLDLGGGTGANLEFIGDERIARLKKLYLLDLSPSLLQVARQRIKERGWTNVECIEADATTWTPPEGQVDIVTCSYSLTMIPDWFRAVDQAAKLLRQGGTFAAVDFYQARKYPEPNRAQHSWFTRTFWPAWFGADNVFLSADHIPYLQNRFKTTQLLERRARVPYIPLIKVPYYLFTGQLITEPSLHAEEAQLELALAQA